MSDKAKLVFSIPDSYMVHQISKALCQARCEHPFWFYDDFSVAYAYGVPDYCVWSGEIPIDQVNVSFLFPSDYMDVVCDSYRKYGVQYCMCMTNYLLKPSDYHNLYANKILELLNERGGMVKVASREMADYVKKFSNLKVCWSDTTNFGENVIQQIETINELSSTNLVIVPRFFNNRFELISKFTHPENLEFVVNDECADGCPFRKQHADNLCKYHLFETEEWSCLLHGNKVAGDIYRHRISRMSIGNYVSMGIRHFNLYGLAPNIQMFLDAYIHFFLQPQYGKTFVDFLNGHKA